MSYTRLLHTFSVPGVTTTSGCFVKITQGGGSAAMWYTGGLISALFSLVEPCVQVAAI